MMRRALTIALAAVLCLGAATSRGDIVLSGASPNYSQDFNSLASTGTSSAVPADWSFSEAASQANATYAAGTGSDNGGDTYSFGSAASSERAFGGLQSGNLIPMIGAKFANGGPDLLTSLSVSCRGEEWRLGNAGRTDRLDFQYSTNATSLTTGTWINVDALDFTTPNTTAPTGAKDGNATGNFTNIAATISSLSIASGSSFWIRWTDLDVSSSDDGLAVDDFSVTAMFTVVPEASSFLFGGLACVVAVVGTVVARRRRHANQVG